MIARRLRIALLAVVSAYALSLAAAWPLPGELHVVTWLSMTFWGVAAAMDRGPLPGPTSDLGILLVAGGIAALTLPLRRLPARGRWLLDVAALPAALGLVAGAVFALGLGGLVGPLALALGSLLARRRGPRPIPPWALPLALLLGWMGLLTLHALYISGPGIQPAPVADGGLWGAARAILGGLPSGQGTGLLLRVLTGAGAMALATWSGGRGGAAAGAPWLLGLGRIAAVLGLAAAGPWLSDVWRCPAPDPAIRSLDGEPGTFQLAVVGDQLWVNDREARLTRRFALPAGAPLPPVRWEDEVPDAWPEELVPVQGGAWVALVVGEEDGSVLVRVDADGRVGLPRRLPGCFVASSATLPGGELLLGCEYRPEFLRLDPGSGEVLDRFEVPGMGSAEEVLLARGRAYAVALWSAPWLVEIDLEARRALRSRFAGDFNWGLAWAPGPDLLAVPRFLGRRLDLYDRATLAPRGRLPGELGGRAIVFNPRDQAFYSAGTFSGRLRRSSLDGSTATLPVGAMVRTLALVGDTLYLGGRCGVRAVDLSAWRGR